VNPNFSNNAIGPTGRNQSLSNVKMLRFDSIPINKGEQWDRFTFNYNNYAKMFAMTDGRTRLLRIMRFG